MSDVVIRAEGLGKQYCLDPSSVHARSHWKYQTLRETMANRASQFARAAIAVARGHPPVRGSRDTSNDFWALRDVNFEVKQGEVLGVIGGNGAGKSTLLKILSRITEPTEGQVAIHGRVSSLLEVGTGFHPELTGRENILLNGAVLGMTRAEIRRKFDEIVDFAGFERFLDTPVKRYSSGMYLRLAFAVAAHLEPEILIVDEVLAVGDAEFQRKCLGKMKDVAGHGRTVLVVSHNMGAVVTLCERVACLEAGRLRHIGPAEEVVSDYLARLANGVRKVEWKNLSDAPGDGRCRLRSLEIGGADEPVGNAADPVRIAICYEVFERLSPFRLTISLHASDGVLITTSPDLAAGGKSQAFREPGVYMQYCTIPANILNNGIYYLTVRADIPRVETIFRLDYCLSFEARVQGGAATEFESGLPGLLSLPFHWTPPKTITAGRSERVPIEANVN